MVGIITSIRKELQKNVDLKFKESEKRFFKEDVKLMGVRTPIVRKISKDYFHKIKHLEKNQIFKLCEELLKSGISAEATIAFDWAFRLKKQYSEEDFNVFESWLKKYVDSWGKCDDFCTHAFGHLIFLYPYLSDKISSWTKSKNRWLRRAAAVIFIYPTKKTPEKFIELNLKIANLLLTDSDDLVQKGYGWMLKEASETFQKEIFNYILRNKKKMPRTSLRYAIEKMPSELKKQAMIIK